MLAISALAMSPPITPELLVRPPPGLLVMVDLLSGGPLLQALLRVLRPGHRDLEVGGGQLSGYLAVFLCGCTLLLVDLLSRGPDAAGTAQGAAARP